MPEGIADRHLEILLRVDERLASLTQRVEESIRVDTAAIRDLQANHALLASQVRDSARDIQQMSDHRKEIQKLTDRINELERFKKNVMWITAGATTVVTMVVNKILALLPWS